MGASGKVQVAGGLRIAGSATHTDTPSPYLYRTSGVDNLCISTSAQERVRIASNGKVLINSTDNSNNATMVVRGLTDNNHPIIKVRGTNANGYTFLGDDYSGGDESQFTMGLAYSGASLVTGWGVRVSTSANDTYVSSQDTYSTKHSAIKHDVHGWRFLSNSTSQTVTTGSTVTLTERLRISSDGNVGVGVFPPTCRLDVSKASASLVAKFYDTGSNGGMLYNSGPVVGISRVSNGSVSLDGLLFQVGWDKNNNTAYNIDETVFAVGNKGVGIGEDDPQVMLHCSKNLNTTSSYKDAQMIRINGTAGANTMAGIGFGYHTTNPAGSAYPSAWIGAKVSAWTQYVKHDLVFATRDSDTNVEPEERFRITESGGLVQNYDSKYTQRGYFDTQRSSQNASNCPI